MKKILLILIIAVAGCSEKSVVDERIISGLRMENEALQRQIISCQSGREIRADINCGISEAQAVKIKCSDYFEHVDGKIYKRIK